MYFSDITIYPDYKTFSGGHQLAGASPSPVPSPTILGGIVPHSPCVGEMFFENSESETTKVFFGEVFAVLKGLTRQGEA